MHFYWFSINPVSISVAETSVRDGLGGLAGRPSATARAVKNLPKPSILDRLRLLKTRCVRSLALPLFFGSSMPECMPAPVMPHFLRPGPRNPDLHSCRYWRAASERASELGLPGLYSLPLGLQVDPLCSPYQPKISKPPRWPI